MHQDLLSQTQWSVQNINLCTRSNQHRLSLYQPHLKELAYRNHSDQRIYDNVERFARAVKRAEGKDLARMEKEGGNTAERQFFVDLWQGVETIARLRGIKVKEEVKDGERLGVELK